WPQDLPHIDIVRKNADAFFAFHAHAHRLVHLPTFMGALNFPPSDPSFPSTALLHAICGIGGIFRLFGHTYPREADVLRAAMETERQMVLAKACAEDDLVKGKRLLQALQALLIIAYWWWCHARWMEMYSISAKILRNCLPLGLHMSEAFHPLTHSEIISLIPPPTDPLDAEMRRNIFWLAYALERQSGCGNGWPLSLDDIDISQLLPLSSGGFSFGIPWPPAEQRQHPFTPDVLLTHPSGHTEGFELWVKGTILLSRVKNYNMRFRQRRARGDPEVAMPASNAPSGWSADRCGLIGRDADVRKTEGFVELDRIACAFEESFPIRLPQPLTQANLDQYLYTAALMPHVALMILHDPHAHIETMACFSSQRLLSSSRAIFRHLLTVLNTDINTVVLDQFAFFAWFMAGKTLTRFWQVAIRLNACDQVEIFRAEVQQIMHV
ncbi:hypothetical protein K488DRAFT_28114, partial [Vararia minispora EC-137]